MRPFEGYRVLDLTHVLAGPFCTYQLALLGADVVKVEHPRVPDAARGRGPLPDANAEMRGLNYRVQGGNKRAVAIDLSSEAGRALFQRLAFGADVLVENFRVGALDALGLSRDRLRALNPRLVHCSITGFGQAGPWASRNAYDNVIQAVSGMMAATGRGGEPIKTAASVIDYATGMNAAFAIAAALHQRTRTGTGQAIDVAMLDAALMMMAPEAAAASLPEDDIVPIPREAGLGTYRTADGALTLGAFNVRQNRRLWTLLGRADFAVLAGWPEIWAASDAMREVLEEIMLERTAAEWEVALNAAGVPAGRVRTLTEAVSLAHVTERGYLQKRFDGAALPDAPFRFATDGPRLEYPSPTPGSDTDAVLDELGVTADEIARLRVEGVIA